MDMDQIGLEHHALMIAWLAQETVQRFGLEGRAAIREGVRRYGEERGRRMAQNAGAAGLPPDVISFLVFGEIDTSANMWKITQTTPFLQVHATRCAWHDTWEKNELLEAGSLYCLEVDETIMRGFNPTFHFAVDGTLSNGASCCRFLYYGGKIGLMDKIRLAWNRRRYGNKHQRPFSFHVLHYYRTMSRTLSEVFGAEGDQICSVCAQRFMDRFGVSLDRIEAAWGGQL